MTGGSMLADFQCNGYVVRQVLDSSEVDAFLEVMETMLSTSAPPCQTGVHSASFQHLGDEISEFGQESRQYYFHLLTRPGTEPIHPAFYHHAVLAVAEALLGPRLIINNASILAFNPGVTYELGWHRDVIQIPEDEIDDRLFSPDRDHNSVQINLPLLPEACLWVVPGSHRRPNTTEEDAVFAGSRHYAPVGVEMPGAVPVRLAPGEAVFYNNNLIHCGRADDATAARRTLHMGYHSATKPPTWHFYLLDASRLTPEYLARLDPTMRRMMDEYLACRAQYPDMAATWQPGFAAPATG